MNFHDSERPNAHDDNDSYKNGESVGSDKITSGYYLTKLSALKSWEDPSTHNNGARLSCILNLQIFDNECENVQLLIM